MREYNITELKNLIREAYLEVLTENAESSNRKKARRLLKDKNYVTRDNFKAGDEEERIVINTLPSVRYNHFKFAIFFYSLYYQYKKEINKDDVWKLINTYFFNILKEEGDNFDYARYLTDKNNYTLIPLQELLNIIEEYNSNRVEDDNKEYNTSEYPYNGYKIVKILSFNQSQEYSPYCDWCVIKSKQLYNQYTNNGKNCFHYCLRYDYKDTNEPLSMLAVLVDGKGNLRQVTTRANNGDHYYKTEQEVEEHFGIDNFNSVFKPITEEELEQSLDEEERIKLDYRKNIKQYLKQGHKLKDILSKAYDNVAYEKKLALFKIKNNNKYNYINRKGNLLSNEWYDNICYDDDIALIQVRNNNKYNYINKQGDLLSNEWYDEIYYNEDISLFKIKNNNKWNYLDKEDNLMFEEWFDYIRYNKELESFWVINNRKVNYIDKNGKLLFNEWYDWIDYEENNKIDLFKVKRENKCNYINKEGDLLSNEWYDDIWYDIKLNLFKIKFNNKNNYIDIEGNLLFEQWYDDIYYDSNMRLFNVIINNRSYYMDINHIILNKY